LRLRDLYAPNAILAAHVSAWSSGVDVGTNRDPNLNLTRVVQQTVAFHNRAGIVGNPSNLSSYDLLFFDPLDRDAGFYQAQYGDGSCWWDERNQQFPNFDRYHAYLKGVTDGTNRRGVLWQVPIGNTKLRTVDNSWGHYQDNRAQYWLGGYPNDGRLQALANSGVIGILFGMGASGVTSYQDAQGDGVTNPAPINGNTQVAAVADDDGGYLRQIAQRYYALGPLVFESELPRGPSTPAVSLVRAATNNIIHYSASTSGFGPIAGYVLYRRTSLADPLAGPLLTNLGAGAGSFTTPRAPSGKVYYYNVRAFDTAGNWSPISIMLVQITGYDLYIPMALR
jgi:hypothetical protein